MRYLATIELYVSSEEEAQQIAKEIEHKYDNQAKVVSTQEAPYAKIGELQ